MALREIAAHFGFSVDKSKLDETDKAIGGVKEHAEESASGVNLMVEAFQVLAGLEIVRMTHEWVDSLAEAGDGLNSTATLLGLSTRDLQIWQFGVAQAGESSEDFTNALKRLAQGIAGGDNGLGTSAALFARLHIKTKEANGSIRSIGDILPEIADHFHSMQDGAQKAALSQELFGKSGPKLLGLLSKGSAAVADLSKEFDELGGGFSPEMIEQSGKIKEELAGVNLAFTSLKNQLALAILPRFQTFLEYAKHAAVYMTDLAKETTLATSGVTTLAEALAITLGAALFPYIGGALKFAAIFLAVDDLKGFLEGQDSEIGSILDSWFGDGTADVVREWCLDAFTSLRNTIDDMVVITPIFGNAFMGVLAGMAEAFNGFVLGIENKWNGLIDSLGLNDRFKIDTTYMTKQLEASKTSSQGYADKQYVAEQRAQKYISESTPTANNIAVSQPAPFKTAMTQAPTQTSWNMVQSAPVITINVPAGTPQAQTDAIGRQTREALRDSHRAALQTLENRK